MAVCRNFFLLSTPNLMLLTLLTLAIPLNINALQIPFSVENSSKHLISHRTEQYITSLIDKWNSSGLAIAVVRQDPTSPAGWHHEFGSYGIANARGDAVTPDTVFAIASNSKLFLASSVGLLISNKTLREERGKELKWTTKAKEVYGDLWGLMDEDMDRGTSLQDMLSHRTGMPRHDFSGVAREGGVAEMISTMRHLRPSAEFRQTFQYNNLMYETLSYLPELLLNQTFESYVAQHIFKPLNMSSSTYDVKEAEKRGTFADGFQASMRDITKGFNGIRMPTVPYFCRPGEERNWAGAGGVLASSRDLTIWASTLLNNGRHPYTNKIVIPEDVLDHAATGVTVSEGKASYPELSPKVYGAGQWRYTYRGHEIIEHGGNNPGYKSQVARFPDDNLAIIALSNDGNGGFLMEAVKWRIADDILFGEGNGIDWNSRYEDVWFGYVNDSQSLTSRPDSPKPPTLPISLLSERTYTHPAYGTLQPCLVPESLSSTPSSFFHPDMITTSHPNCPKLLNSLPVRRILERSNMTVPTFIIPWKRSFVTHLRLEHFNENNFNVTVLFTNAEVRAKEGYARVPPAPCITVENSNKSEQAGGWEWEDDGDIVIGLDNRFEIEWVQGDEEGLAFKGGFWGKEGLDSKAPEGAGKDSAEVWFAKV